MLKGLKCIEQFATAGLGTIHQPLFYANKRVGKGWIMESTDRMCTVYMHITPTGKRYIGITRNVAHRWGGDGIRYKKCPYFWNAIVKHGWGNISHEIISEGLTEAEAKQREKDLIIAYKTRNSLYGYNMTDGGEGICGCARSEATKAKLRAANLGRKDSAATRAAKAAVHVGNKYNLGRKHTNQSRSNMGAAKLGHKVSDLTRAKLSAALLGRKLSDSARSKLMGNKNSLGHKHTAETKQKMRDAHNRRSNGVECLTMDGEIVSRYISLVDAEEKTGIHKSGICQVCLGRRKTAGNLRWRYV